MIRRSLLYAAPMARRAASLPAAPVSWRLVGNPPSPVPFMRKRAGTPPGLELTVERLGEADFTFLASYVLSRSYGNYTGLFASDVPAGGANISPQTISPRSS